MHKSVGQELNRPLERLCIRHVRTSMCPIFAIARDIHVQYVVLQRQLPDFFARELCTNQANVADEAVTWRRDLLFSGEYGEEIEALAKMHQKRNISMLDRRRQEKIPQNEFSKLLKSPEGLSNAAKITYLRAAAVTLAYERCGSEDARTALKRLGGWQTQKGQASVFDGSYMYGVSFEALAAVAGGSVSGNVVTYVLELNRDTLPVGDALLSCFANGLVDHALDAFAKMQTEGWPSIFPDTKGRIDHDLFHYKDAIREYAKVFWQDVAAVFVTMEKARASYFMRTCVLDVVEKSFGAKEAWKTLLHEAFKRKEEGSVLPSNASTANNGSIDANGILTQIGRMQHAQLEQINSILREEERKKRDEAISQLKDTGEKLGIPSEAINALVLHNRGGKRSDNGYLTSPSPPRKKQKDSPETPANTIPLERVRVNHSRSLPDFVANYQCDRAVGEENWGHAKLQQRLSRKETQDHQNNVRQKRNWAKKNFEHLSEALRGIDVDELNTRMLNKVAREATNAEGVKTHVHKEIQRVAALMKKKCTDLGETASRDDISRVYANTLEEEWPALSTTTASKDDAMDEED
ncbi:unnamed protein product [Bathycoccus prasinos]